jgi:hypothetical protein
MVHAPGVPLINFYIVDSWVDQIQHPL